VNEPITITHLGLIDDGSDGMSAAHAVGVWTNAGTLLASATVPAGTGGTLVGQFRYVPITPIELTADQVYRVGGQMPNEVYLSDVTYAPVPQILIVDAAYTFFGTGANLTFPGPNVYSPATAIAISALGSLTPL
jgi:hypothetical protein